MVVARKDSFAGSWYQDDGEALTRELNDHLKKAKQSTEVYSGKKVKAIIAPHAGYRYSAPTSAYGFNCVLNASNFKSIKTIFVLGPCHRIYLEDQCVLSKCDQCNTPLGALRVNKTIQNELATKYSELFGYLKDKKSEEDEHSLELQFPFIAHIFKEQMNQIQIIPIMVGDLSKDSINMMAEALCPYFESDDSFFVISSDFCHWGKRFNYQYVINKDISLSKSIEQLDMLAVEKITQQSKNPEEFYNYLKKYKNTICGKNPILVMLSSLKKSVNWNNHESVFLKYSQSSAAKSMEDSSVSYVSVAILQ